jgi:hypothetical protein
MFAMLVGFEHRHLWRLALDQHYFPSEIELHADIARQHITEEQYQRLIQVTMRSGFDFHSGSFEDPQSIAKQPIYIGSISKAHRLMFSGLGNLVMFEGGNKIDLNLIRVQHDLRERLQASCFYAKPSSASTQNTSRRGFECFKGLLPNKNTLPLNMLYKGTIFGFTTCSRTVFEWARQLEQLEKLDQRMAQLLGFREILAIGLPGYMDRLTDFYVMQRTVFKELYVALTEKIDTNHVYSPEAKQHYQGLVGHAHLATGRLLNYVAYELERLAYSGDPNPSNEKTGQLNKVLQESENIVSEVPGFSAGMAYNQRQHSIGQEMYQMQKEAQRQKFKPTLYFHGGRNHPSATGTGTILCFCLLIP